MLDADSVFERLLREAANLVPKMSTPKLTAALKVSSALQQRITDTVASRLHQEQISVSNRDFKNFSVQCLPSLVGAPLLSDELLSDGNFLPNSDNNFSNCYVSTANYGNLPFPQINQFVSQRTATLVTITNPHGPGIAGATVVGTLTPGATLIQQSEHSTCTNMNDANISPTSSNNAIQCAGSVSMSVNGQMMMSGNGLDLKPDPVACLARAAVVGLNTRETLFTTSSSNDLATSLAFVHMPTLTPASSMSDGLFSTVSNPTIPNTLTNSSASLKMKTVTTLASMACSDNLSSPNSANGAVVNTSSNSIIVGGKNGPYGCCDCGKEFRIMRYLEKHRRIHTGEKPYQCCYCGRQFNDWPNMNRHKRIHTGERPYRCSVCTKTFSQPAVYNEHVKRHTGERPYICTVCAKGFPRAARLAVHMRVHTGERPYPCTACDRRFSQPHHLTAHLRVHSGDRPFSCFKCDVSFACISNLRRHRKQVHASSFPTVNTTNDSSIPSVENKFILHSTPFTTSTYSTEDPKGASNGSTSTQNSMHSLPYSSSDGLTIHSLPPSLNSCDLSSLASSCTNNNNNTSDNSLLHISESELISNHHQQHPQQIMMSSPSTVDINSGILLPLTSNTSMPSVVHQHQSIPGSIGMDCINISMSSNVNGSDSVICSQQHHQQQHLLHNNQSNTVLDLVPCSQESNDQSNQFLFDGSHQSMQPADGTIYINSIDSSGHANISHISSSLHPSGLISSSSASIANPPQNQQVSTLPIGQFSFAPNSANAQHQLGSGTVVSEAVFPGTDSCQAGAMGSNSINQIQLCYSSVTSGHQKGELSSTTIIIPTTQMFPHLQQTDASGKIDQNQSSGLAPIQHHQFAAGSLLTTHGQQTLLAPISAAQMTSLDGNSSEFLSATSAGSNHQLPIFNTKPMSSISQTILPMQWSNNSSLITSNFQALGPSTDPSNRLSRSATPVHFVQSPSHLTPSPSRPGSNAGSSLLTDNPQTSLK